MRVSTLIDGLALVAAACLLVAAVCALALAAPHVRAFRRRRKDRRR